MKIITRAEAKAQDLKVYFTGKPCKHGHISERYTKTYQCVECSTQYYANHTEERKAYDKKHRAANKKQVATYKKQYSIDHKEELAAYQKQYYQDNKEKRLAYKREQYRKNKLKKEQDEN